MVMLECHIGMASKTVDVPAAFVGDPKFIGTHFSTGSNNVIELLTRNHCDQESLVSDDQRYVDALDLHRCVQQLTGNVPGTGRVNKIALILADRYQPRPSVFGIMFDRGYATDDDPNATSVFTGTPREGCAIFLGAINELRSSIADFNREVEFTTIHELGHIFNLEHVSSPSNFMASSRVDTPFSDDYFNFLNGQRNWLSECDTNAAVYPGGSRFDPVSGLNKPNEPTRYSSTSEFVLTISMTNMTFPCASPVELDVELRLAHGERKMGYIPDKFDPGYAEFKIWIIHPGGERRLFKSPRRYCTPVSKVALYQNKPIRRDISVFEEAGGSVFSKPGLYHIQAEFELGRGKHLVSNLLTIEAIANSKLMANDRIRLLSSHSVRRFLYHRSKKCGGAVLKALTEHLKANPAGGNCQPSCRLNTCDYAAILSSKSPSIFSSFAANC